MPLLVQLVVLMFSVIVHEVAHGWVASLNGDNTAKAYGRVTLNPIPHIDLFGTIILPLVFLLSGSSMFIGWAKPVPINPAMFRNYKLGLITVSLAGPFSNIFLALIGSLSLYVLNSTGFVHTAFGASAYQLAFVLIFINIFLFVLNLIPIPPLDGSKVLENFLPPSARMFFRRFEMYGMFLVIILFFSGIFSKVFMPLISFLINIFTGGAYI